MKSIWISAYFLMVALWLALAAFCPRARQMSAFLDDGGLPLWDHVLFRTAADAETPYQAGEGAVLKCGTKIPRRDVCYPALAMMMVKSVPNTVAGGWIFIAVGALGYLFAAWVFLRRYGGDRVGVNLLMLAGALPFVLSVHVGNMILYSAAAALLFLTWYDSPRRALKVLAAVCLAFSAVLKVSPVILGLLWLGRGWKRNLGLAALSAVAFALLMLLPFALFGGAQGFFDWLENARLNALAYTNRNGFGIYGMLSAWSQVLGYRHELPDLAFTLARAGSVVLALGCLFRAVFREGEPLRRIALVVIGMIFLPPTMMIYVSLYVLPALLAMSASSDTRLSKAATFAFIAIAVPLQIPLILGSANECFSSVALVDIALLLIWERRRARNQCRKA